MRIGFDFDKVFIDYPPFFPTKLVDKLYKKQDNGTLIYRMPNSLEQIVRKATHLPFMRPAIRENFEILKKISKRDNKLYLISSRYKFLQKETNRLIRKYQLDKVFDSMYFNYENMQPHLFKNEVLKTLKLDAYIDDDLSLLRHVAKYNPKTKFYWLNHAYDKQILPKNIIEIKKLAEIFR